MSATKICTSTPCSTSTQLLLRGGVGVAARRRSRHICQQIQQQQQAAGQHQAGATPAFASSFTGEEGETAQQHDREPKPSMIARRCSGCGRPDAAMPIAIALSLASVRSISTTWTKAVRRLAQRMLQETGSGIASASHSPETEVKHKSRGEPQRKSAAGAGRLVERHGGGGGDVQALEAAGHRDAG